MHSFKLIGLIGSSFLRSVFAVVSGLSLLLLLPGNSKAEGYVDSKNTGDSAIGDSEVAILLGLAKKGIFQIDQDNQVQVNELELIRAVQATVEHLNSINQNESKEEVLKNLMEKMEVENYKRLHQGAIRALGMSFKDPN